MAGSRASGVTTITWGWQRFRRAAPVHPAAIETRRPIDDYHLVSCPAQLHDATQIPGSPEEVDDDDRVVGIGIDSIQLIEIEHTVKIAVNEPCLGQRTAPNWLRLAFHAPVFADDPAGRTMPLDSPHRWNWLRFLASPSFLCQKRPELGSFGVLGSASILGISN